MTLGENEQLQGRPPLRYRPSGVGGGQGKPESLRRSDMGRAFRGPAVFANCVRRQWRVRGGKSAFGGGLACPPTEPDLAENNRLWAADSGRLPLVVRMGLF